MTERRRNLRTHVDETIYYSTITCADCTIISDIKANVVDISESGIGIMTENRIETGCILMFDYRGRRTAGIVQWVMCDRISKLYIAGVEFIALKRRE